jgi:HK97 family phage portal protein
MFDGLKTVFDRLLPGQRKSFGLIQLGLSGEIPALTFGGSALVTIAQIVRHASANPTASAAVRLIARSAAGVPWVLYRRSSGPRGKVHRVMSTQSALRAMTAGHPAARRGVELSEVEDHPLLKLLERPNPRTGGGAYATAVVSWLYLSGNSFEHVVAAGGPRGRPQELWVLPSTRVEIETDTSGEPTGYRLNGQSELIPPAAVATMKFFNPFDDVYGMSPLASAHAAMVLDRAATRWNIGLLRNSARPPTAFTAEGGLSDVQYERLRAEIADRYAGAENAGRPLLIEGGLKAKVLGLSPAEMDWASLRRMSKLEVAEATGVAPELLGAAENKTFANMEHARKSLIEETVLPLLDAWRDERNNWLTPRFGDNLRLDYDRDQIGALQEDLEKLWNRVSAAPDLTVNEKRRARGYDDIEGGDVIMISSALTPLSIASRDPFEELDPAGKLAVPPPRRQLGGADE